MKISRKQFVKFVLLLIVMK